MNYKHKNTGDIAVPSITGYSYNIYKAGSENTQHLGTFIKEYIEDTCDWEPIKEKLPVGTKVEDTYQPIDYRNIYTKMDNKEWLLTSSSPKFTIKEHEIGENKRFRVIKKEERVPAFKTEKGENVYKGDDVWIYNKLHDYVYRIFLNNWKPNNDEVPFLTQKDAEEYKANHRVIFTTEDGVKIKKGDKFWPVSKTQCTTYESSASEDSGQLKGAFLYFSTKEKAIEWIMLNKPCLSINDIGTIFKSVHLDHQHQYQDIRKLVKSKLNI